MRINVNRSVCQNHGQCVISAPDYFGFGEAGALEYTEDVHPDDVDDVQDAADVCPVQAIFLLGSNDDAD